MALALVVGSLQIAGPAAAEGPSQETAEQAADAETAQPETPRKARSLAALMASRRVLSAELAALQAELESNAARGREQDVRAQIQQVAQKLDEVDLSFSELAAQVDPTLFQARGEEGQIDLGGEVRQLLGPLINELKRATSRPREMDRLRTEIAQASERLELLDIAIANVERLRGGVDDATLQSALAGEAEDWRELRQELQTRLEVDQQKLDHMESEQTSFGDAVESVFELFFKSRGRNLVLALAATVMFMLLLRRLHARALESGPLQRHGDALWPRLLNLLFVVFMAIGGVLVFLVVLYFFGDWVLLILVLLLVFGALWASKQAIPRFWTQATLLLNLGPVREGERLMVGRVAYLVESLNFYTELVNETLIGGRLRLPIGDLTDLRSRPYDDAEPWFPSAVGDWVVLADESFGQIEVQTPEQVVMQLKGGARRTFGVDDYLSAAPTNLSAGFTARLVFGLDYRHQAEITTEIPRRLGEFVTNRLRDSVVGDAVGDVETFFAAAGSSSLDLRIAVDLDGSAAPFYRIVPRMVAGFCVDACNEYGWTIPFEQITVHAAGAPPDRLEPEHET